MRVLPAMLLLSRNACVSSLDGALAVKAARATHKQELTMRKPAIPWGLLLLPAIGLRVIGLGLEVWVMTM